MAGPSLFFALESDLNLVQLYHISMDCLINCSIFSIYSTMIQTLGKNRAEEAYPINSSLLSRFHMREPSKTGNLFPAQ